MLARTLAHHMGRLSIQPLSAPHDHGPLLPLAVLSQRLTPITTAHAGLASAPDLPLAPSPRTLTSAACLSVSSLSLVQFHALGGLSGVASALNWNCLHCA